MADIVKNCVNLERYQEAIDLAKERIDIYEKNFGEFHASTASAYILLADTYISAKNKPFALKTIEKAKNIYLALEPNIDLTPISTRLEQCNNF